MKIYTEEEALQFVNEFVQAITYSDTRMTTLPVEEAWEEWLTLEFVLSDKVKDACSVLFGYTLGRGVKGFDINYTLIMVTMMKEIKRRFPIAGVPSDLDAKHQRYLDDVKKDSQKN